MSDQHYAVEVDSAAAQQRIAAIIENIDTLPDRMEAELVAWQREDMKRQRPNASRPDAWSVTTLIWPRSRTSMAPRPSRLIRYRDAARRLIGRRPILRPELLEALRARMRAMLHDVMPKKQQQ